MRDISSLEIGVIANELKSFITGSRVRKIYYLGEDSFRITFYGESKTMHLYVKLLKTINETNFTEGADEPNGFVMGLRKRLENRIVNSIEQKSNDRILQISIGKEHFLLIIEMLAKGNILLLDEFGKIELTYKSLEFSDRTLKPGHEYKYPKGDSISIEEASEKLDEIFFDHGANKIISILSKKINLGPLYIEDILNRSRIDPKAKIINEAEKSILSKELLIFKERLKTEKPRVFMKNNSIEDYAVCSILKYESYESKEFQTLNELLDFLYLHERSVITDNGKGERLKEAKINIGKQEKLALSLAEESKLYSIKGKKIMENMNLLNEAIFYLQKNRRTTIEELKTLFPDLNILDLDLKSKTITIKLED